MRHTERPPSSVAASAILIALLLAGTLRAADVPRNDLSLEAKARSAVVEADTLMLVDLKVTNTGQRPTTFGYPKTEHSLVVMRRGLRFELRQGEKTVPRYRSGDKRTVLESGLGSIEHLGPGQSVAIVGCVNWEYALDTPGEYTCTATLGRFGDVLQSNQFTFTVKPVHPNARTARINAAEAVLLAVEKTEAFLRDEEVTVYWPTDEALLFLAFCGTPESVGKLTNLVIRNPRFVTYNARDALRIALDRLPDNAQALSHAHALLKASHWELRRIGLTIIASRGTAADALAVIPFLDDSESNVVWDALYALRMTTAFKPVYHKDYPNGQLADEVKQAKEWWAKRTIEKRP